MLCVSVNSMFATCFNKCTGSLLMFTDCLPSVSVSTAFLQSCVNMCTGFVSVLTGFPPVLKLTASLQSVSMLACLQNFNESH